jgi:(1->4)-alpha-D-glucan 1-alpha-D-glucosylmutase
LWDFSLVDPDNRRPVDWDTRLALLNKLGGMQPRDLAADWQDGREKLFVTHRLLALRRAHPRLFAEGNYQPVEAAGDRSGHLCALARNHDGVSLVVAVPRLTHQLYRGGEVADWGDAEIVLPPGGRWRDVFTGRRLDRQDRVAATELFADFPVSVLIGGS